MYLPDSTMAKQLLPQQLCHHYTKCFQRDFQETAQLEHYSHSNASADIDCFTFCKIKTTTDFTSLLYML